MVYSFLCFPKFSLEAMHVLIRAINEKKVPLSTTLLVHTQFVMWAHTPKGDRRHRSEVEGAAGHSPHRRQPDSVGVNLVDTLPPAAKHQYSKSHIHATIHGVCLITHFFAISIIRNI